MSMSSGLLSGQLAEIRYSALRVTLALFISGLMSANEMNTIMEKPISTLSSMSVNGTKVPSSLPPKRLSSRNIGTPRARRQHRNYVHLGHLCDVAEEVGDGFIEEVVRQLQEQRRANTGDGDIQRNCHAAGHARQRPAQRLRVKCIERGKRNQHQDEPDCRPQ